MFKCRLTCFEMKLRARVICVIVTGITLFVTLLLYEGVATWSTEESGHNSVSSFKGHFENILGFGVDYDVAKKPGMRLNNVQDIKDQLYMNSNSQETDNTLPLRRNKTVMFDKAVEWLFDGLDKVERNWLSRDSIRQVTLADMTSRLGTAVKRSSKRLPWGRFAKPLSTNYEKFHYNARAAALYDPDDPAIDGLLHDMATMEFRKLEMMERGTELKLLITFENGAKAVFKPMRWPRDHETLPNHFYFNDYERHNAEIAAFHLDRLLGFYRVPPVTGRLVNMTREIFTLAEKALRKTFYVSPIGNLCFYGDCSYYCDSRHSFCGNVDIIEGSLMAWLPEPPIGDRDRWKSPYRRSYSKFRKADWEEDEGYCDMLMEYPPFLYDRFMADLIDAHVFDFITGNMDRHHIEVFRHLRNGSCPLHMDNGRGFGKPKVDEFSILVPLRQCCVIRTSTFLKIAKLYIGPDRLSDLLDESMKSDPVYPILTPGHLEAVDRRVIHILRTIALCVKKKKSITDVIIDDPF